MNWFVLALLGSAVLGVVLASREMTEETQGLKGVKEYLKRLSKNRNKATRDKKTKTEKEHQKDREASLKDLSKEGYDVMRAGRLHTLANAHILLQDALGRNNIKCNPRFQVQCPSGRCIHAKELCDGVVHCEGAWDEFQKNCKKTDCPPAFIRCNTTMRCVAASDLCDRANDCGDWEDEDEARCGTVNCGQGMKKCPGFNVCLHEDYFCNVAKDCPNGGDEDITCASIACDGFRCKGTGGCVSRDKVCNGKMDCADHSDEQTELCGVVRCPENLEPCGDARYCFKNQSRCDGVCDCPNCADELNCGPGKHLEASDTSDNGDGNEENSREHDTSDSEYGGSGDEYAIVYYDVMSGSGEKEDQNGGASDDSSEKSEESAEEQLESGDDSKEIGDLNEKSDSIVENSSDESDESSVDSFDKEKGRKPSHEQSGDEGDSDLDDIIDDHRESDNAIVTSGDEDGEESGEGENSGTFEVYYGSAFDYEGSSGVERAGDDGDDVSVEREYSSSGEVETVEESGHSDIDQDTDNQKEDDSGNKGEAEP